ncbi:response regulator [Leptolyngbya sp. FACHB-16]|uniref:hybrid sensor histidine kinase/response regulator n=1 Tax=unclassified Leptolyngbya TaxID=2650499 RepID=UPI0016823C89|nr:response regulator [Leptolyngbya sp. FACHB-16]MBD2156855.1 response regulator [Leptolyngbya sp. FACHB-16]
MTTLPSSTILVVDDNPTNIQVLFDVLNESGYEVAVAKSGESALSRLQSHLPDLILLDVMMPGIDGFEACRRIKEDEQTRDIPVIFMTALSDAVDKVKGLSLGAVDYITKPIQHEEVLARIRVHLQLRNLNKTLEQKVAERTSELNQALQDLQQSQVRLIQNEKMSLLGQLVAGVAHEINNPVNFIYGNIQPAEEYTCSLMDLVELFCEEYPSLTPKIQERMEEIDFEFLKGDLPQLLQSMKVGADRIRQIILSLRSFSRLDEADMKEVDLHECIDSTLMILQHRLKAKLDRAGIEIVKEYGDLPPVQCYPSQLNQVFMNLLCNSIDALEDTIAQNASKNISSLIRIQTGRLGGDRIFVKVADNGPGIPEDVRSQVFDAFFTTKSLGKGTGLGLSISHQIIVEKHRGQLTCHSTPGHGAEFVIEIPR